MEHTNSDYDPFAEKSQLGNETELSPLAKEYLLEAAKWAKFIAIIGFIGIGLMVLLSLFMGIAFSTIGALAENGPSSMPGLGMYSGAMGGLMTFLYLIMAALYFAPTLFLFRFATKTQKALKAYDSEQLTDGIGNLKSMFKFMGIFAAIMIGLYGLGIVIMIIAGTAGAFM